MWGVPMPIISYTRLVRYSSFLEYYLLRERKLKYSVASLLLAILYLWIIIPYVGHIGRIYGQHIVSVLLLANIIVFVWAIVRLHRSMRYNNDLVMVCLQRYNNDPDANNKLLFDDLFDSLFSYKFYSKTRYVFIFLTLILVILMFSVLMWPAKYYLFVSMSNFNTYFALSIASIIFALILVGICYRVGSFVAITILILYGFIGDLIVTSTSLGSEETLIVRLVLSGLILVFSYFAIESIYSAIDKTLIYSPRGQSLVQNIYHSRLKVILAIILLFTVSTAILIYEWLAFILIVFVVLILFIYAAHTDPRLSTIAILSFLYFIVYSAAIYYLFVVLNPIFLSLLPPSSAIYSIYMSMHHSLGGVMDIYLSYPVLPVFTVLSVAICINIVDYKLYLLAKNLSPRHSRFSSYIRLRASWRTTNIACGISLGSYLMTLIIMMAIRPGPQLGTLSLDSVESYVSSLLGLLWNISFEPLIYGVRTEEIISLPENIFIISVPIVYFSLIFVLYLVSLSALRARVYNIKESMWFSKYRNRVNVRIYPNSDLLGRSIYNPNYARLPPSRFGVPLIYVVPFAITVFLTYLIMLIQYHVFPAERFAFDSISLTPEILFSLNFVRNLILSLVIIYIPIHIELQWYNSILKNERIVPKLDRIALALQTRNPTKQDEQIIEELSDHEVGRELNSYMIKHGVIAGNAIRSARNMIVISLTSLANIFLIIFGTKEIILYFIQSSKAILDNAILIGFGLIFGVLLLIFIRKPSIGALVLSILTFFTSILIKTLILPSWLSLVIVGILLAIIIYDMKRGLRELSEHLRGIEFHGAKHIGIKDEGLALKIAIIVSLLIITILTMSIIGILVISTFILYETMYIVSVGFIYRSPITPIDDDELSHIESPTILQTLPPNQPKPTNCPLH